MNRPVVAAALTVAALVSSVSAQTLQPADWRSACARDEIRPEFECQASGLLIIRSDDREGLAGHWEKTFAVTGGQCYRFSARRQVQHVASPRQRMRPSVERRGDATCWTWRRALNR